MAEIVYQDVNYYVRKNLFQWFSVHETNGQKVAKFKYESSAVHYVSTKERLIRERIVII